MRNIGLFTALLLASSSVQNAAAQEQTIENAQIFLGKALPGSDYIPATYSTMVALFIANTSDYRFRPRGTGRITSVESPGRCRTAIFFDPGSLSVQTSERHYRQGQPLNSWSEWKDNEDNLAATLERENYRKGAIAGAPSGFSWSDVTEVSVSGNQTSVSVYFKQLDKPAVIDLRSKDMSARVAYAMEFLRSNCDETAGTGF